MTSAYSNPFSPLNTDPPSFQMAVTEEWPLGLDFTDDLGPGDAVTEPIETTLYDTTAGALVTLADSPTIFENTVVQIVRGSALTLGHNYRLEATAKLNTQKVATTALVIQCSVPAP